MAGEDIYGTPEHQALRASVRKFVQAELALVAPGARSGTVIEQREAIKQDLRSAFDTSRGTHEDPLGDLVAGWIAGIRGNPAYLSDACDLAWRAAEYDWTRESRWQQLAAFDRQFIADEELGAGHAPGLMRALASAWS